MSNPKPSNSESIKNFVDSAEKHPSTGKFRYRAISGGRFLVFFEEFPGNHVASECDGVRSICNSRAEARALARRLSKSYAVVEAMNAFSAAAKPSNCESTKISNEEKSK